jgi:hypothetical protein
MPTSENARLLMEAGQDLVEMELLTDSGDHQTFTGSESPWSGVQDKVPVIMPNGVRSGGKIIPKAGSNNAISVAALEVNLNGVKTSVNAGDVTSLDRPSGTDGKNFRKVSIIVDNAGALSKTAGTDHTAFSTVRGDPGGPPLIAADAVEIGQVWFSSVSAAVVKESEIKQVVGVHLEMYNYPLWTVDFQAGAITFYAELPLIHTGPVAKRTYAEYYTPILTELPDVNNFKFAEESHSISSEQTYSGVRATTSKSLAAGGFDIKLQSGVSDLVVQQKGKNLWFDFYPDKFQADHGLTQGILGLARTFPADGAMSATCTISSEKPSTEVQG